MSVALGRIDGLVLPRQRYWDFAGGYAILHEIGMSFHAYRDSWSDPVDEQTLTRAQASDHFHIVAARDRGLFNDLASLLTDTIS